uniref:Uncharacterized protein n=1 Tax=Takifugu rubripes TaxID=31033 RepID=A0A674MHI6_TAKRU
MLLFFSQNMWPMLGIPILPLIGGASIRYIVHKEVNNWYPSPKNPSYLYDKKKNRLLLCRYGSYLELYGLQLVLIWAWPVFLYGAHKLNWLFIDIILVTVGVIVISWYPISRTVALLMVP